MYSEKVWRSSERSVCWYSDLSQTARSSKRSAITEFSRKSRTRLRRQLQNADPPYSVMITLTYGKEFASDGRKCKEDLLRFRDQLRRYGFLPESSVWVLEFQRRGAPHFHILTSMFIPKMALSWLWNWASGAPVRTATNIKAVRNATGYALKYASKLEQKDCPPQFQNVGRFWGIWGTKYHAPTLVATIETQTGFIEDISRVTAEELREIGNGRVVIRHERGFISYNRREK